MASSGITLTLNEANDLPSESFIKIFGNVVEHYPAAAICILKNRPFESAEEMSEAVSDYLDALTSSEVEKILQFHPDLAGKMAEAKQLTHESAEEQKSAGLHNMSSEEKAKLDQLNKHYKSKFGFPFIICARENKIHSILTAIEKRLENTKKEELQMGIEEVKKISKLRIMQIIRS